ncbi:hypothetical protein [Nonomuraea sp. NPDC049400]|uniref:hypothetical protein n=1 Tax=Nonomuraea sp. NPDC049400 TaxID=3364352 RepID=UPI0037B66521
MALSACQGSTSAVPPSTTPTPMPSPSAVISTADVPRSKGIAVTQEQLANSDPCGLLDTRSLSKFGKADIELAFSFTECEAQVDAVEGLAEVELGFDFGLPRESMKPTVRGGVTVYADSDDPNWCQRSVVVSPTATVNLAVDSGVPAKVRCAIADAAAKAMAARLAKGSLKRAQESPNSLAWQDACRLLDHNETAHVPGIDRTRVHPAFRGQHCTWGEETVDKPNVFVSFSRDFPLKVRGTRDRETVIGGRSAVLRPEEAVDGPDYRTMAGCGVDIAHRPLDRPSDLRTLEIVHVSVSFDGPEKTRCDLAVELATKAVSRLPSP